MKRRRRVRRCLLAFSALNSPGINFSAAFRGSGRRIRIIRTTQTRSLLYNMYIVASETHRPVSGQTQPNIRASNVLRPL